MASHHEQSAASAPPQPNGQDDAILARLLEMGFDFEQVQLAVAKCNGNLEKALAIVTNEAR